MVNTPNLKAELAKQQKTCGDVAKLLGKSYSMASKKVRGEYDFSTEEIVKIANALKLTLPQVNAIFFDSKLTDWQG